MKKMPYLQNYGGLLGLPQFSSGVYLYGTSIVIKASSAGIGHRNITCIEEDDTNERKNRTQNLVAN